MFGRSRTAVMSGLRVTFRGFARSVTLGKRAGKSGLGGRSNMSIVSIIVLILIVLLILALVGYIA
jgi:hypothetical protein